MTLEDDSTFEKKTLLPAKVKPKNDIKNNSIIADFDIIPPKAAHKSKTSNTNFRETQSFKKSRKSSQGGVLTPDSSEESQERYGSQKGKLKGSIHQDYEDESYQLSNDDENRLSKVRHSVEKSVPFKKYSPSFIDSKYTQISK